MKSSSRLSKLLIKAKAKYGINIEPTNGETFAESLNELGLWVNTIADGSTHLIRG